MEVALLTRFFDSKILFSLTFETYEKQLTKELFLCKKHLGYANEELMKMTVSKRRANIAIHNKEVEEEKRRNQLMRHRR